MPIRARIALFGAGVVFLTVVIFSVLVYALVNHSVLQQQDASLTRRSNQFGSGPRNDGGGIFGGGGGFRQPVIVDLRTSGDSFVELVGSDGSTLFSTGAIDGQPPPVSADLLRQADLNGSVLATVEASKGVFLRESIRRLTGPSTTQLTASAAYVVAGQPMGPVVDSLNTLRTYLALAALCSLVGALAASWLVAGRALRPVDAMADTAEEIGRTRDLSRRLPALDTGDEVSRLSDSFNSMLAELQDAYQRLEATLATQQRFVADASHELRTPLTTIRGNVGLLLGGKQIADTDRTDALRDIDEESERMTRLIQELLTLARADAGQHLEMAPVDVAGVAADVCRQARRLHPERRLDLKDGKAAPVVGNVDSLRQLLWILVDNAVKHTPGGSGITVAVERAGSDVRISVDDEGAGIPPTERQRVFERFHQADPSRSGEGTGLGLAIAAWIAKEHRGEIQVGESESGGASFRVRLPLTNA
ncbi:MAG TPA: HAMP domain-containing sensor histidine kinase [Candidatus Solibacter sp.]|jgi:two-component system OmpR family sensor kinase|nr:HAMP domain-containing sensor histidine kinase [Candidatus Solibacter sp.]